MLEYQTVKEPLVCPVVPRESITGALKMRDYDDITSFLGTWGPFQLTVFLALAISILPNGFVGTNIVFVGDTPPHKCLIPEEYNISEAWREVAIPMVIQDGLSKPSSCTRYKVDTLRNYSMLGYIPNVDVNMTDIELESCVNGWNYSKEIYQSTIVTEVSMQTLILIFIKELP